MEKKNIFITCLSFSSVYEMKRSVDLLKFWELHKRSRVIYTGLCKHAGNGPLINACNQVIDCRVCILLSTNSRLSLCKLSNQVYANYCMIKHLFLGDYLKSWCCVLCTYLVHDCVRVIHDCVRDMYTWLCTYLVHDCVRYAHSYHLSVFCGYHNGIKHLSLLFGTRDIRLVSRWIRLI